jgi:hypothetical protein
MSGPISNEKDFEQWDFDDLVRWGAWHVTTGLLSGKPLKDSMHYVIDTTLRWKQAADKRAK